MNPEIKALWLEALRSGEYEQGTSYLNMNGQFCCLGVLCDIAVRQGVAVAVATYYDYGIKADSSAVVYYDGDPTTLPLSVRGWAGLDHGNPGFDTAARERHLLAALNDEGLPFEDIATLIEENF